MCISGERAESPNFDSLSTSNQMLGRVSWDKFPECSFLNFEIVRVKRGQFQIFQKSRGWLIPKTTRNKHVFTGINTKPANNLYWNWYLLRAGNYKSASRKLQNSEQLKNDNVNGAMSVSINRVIISITAASDNLTIYIGIHFGDSIMADLTEYTRIWNNIIRRIFINVICTTEYNNIL